MSAFGIIFMRRTTVRLYMDVTLASLGSVFQTHYPITILFILRSFLEVYTLYFLLDVIPNISEKKLFHA